MKVLSNNIKLKSGVKLPEMNKRTLRSVLTTQLHTREVRTSFKAKPQRRGKAVNPHNNASVVAELAALIN